MSDMQIPLFDDSKPKTPNPDWGEQVLQPIPIQKDQAQSPAELVPPDGQYQVTKNYAVSGSQMGRLLQELDTRAKNKQSAKISRQELSSQLTIPSERVESMFIFGRKVELITATNQLTTLGSILLKHDPYFLDTGNIWFLHFLMASNPNLIVWSRLFNHVFYQLSDATPAELVSYFPDIQGNKTEKVYNKNTREEIGAILRTYVDELYKSLGLLIRIDSGRYTIITDEFFISPFVWLASILAYRDRFYAGAPSLEVHLLVDAHLSPGRLFRQKEEVIRQALDSLHNLGLITIETRLGLDQVRFKRDITWVSAIARYFEEGQ